MRKLFVFNQVSLDGYFVERVVDDDGSAEGCRIGGRPFDYPSKEGEFRKGFPEAQLRHSPALEKEKLP